MLNRESIYDITPSGEQCTIGNRLENGLFEIDVDSSGIFKLSALDLTPLRYYQHYQRIIG